MLEIGAGYTTPFILKALSDVHASHRQEVVARQHSNQPHLVGSYYEKCYLPKLLCLDKDSHPYSTASKVADVAGRLGLSDYLEMHYKNFEGYSRKLDLAGCRLIWSGSTVVDCSSMRCS